MAGTKVLPTHEPLLKGNKTGSCHSEKNKWRKHNSTGREVELGETSRKKPCGKKTLREGNSDHMPPNHVKDDSCSELP